MSKTYLHPLPLRIWHWINASIIIALILTGIQLRMPFIQIYPDYRNVVVVHKYLGYAMSVSFLFWFFYYLFTGGFKKHYFIHLKDIKAMPGQALYYMIYIFKGGENPFKPSPDNKFNPMQRLTYSLVMFIFTPVIIFTGILFGDILYFFAWIKFLGGLRIIDAIHVSVAYFFIFYLIVHIYMATLGPKLVSHIKAMISGYEEH